MKFLCFLVFVFLGLMVFNPGWLLRQTELSQFGLNMTTVTLLATIVFAILGAWSLSHQERRIREGRSGRSVSRIWFIWAEGMFVGAIVYGTISRSFALLFTGMAMLYWHTLVLVALLKYSRISVKEVLLGGLCIASALVMIVLPSWGAEIIFSILMFGSVIPRIDVPLQIVREKSSGQVEIRFLIVSLVNTLFWGLYGYATNNIPLVIVNPVLFAIMAGSIFLWFFYRDTTLSSFSKHRNPH